MLTLSLGACLSALDEEPGEYYIVGFKGSCYYYHYGAQGVNDQGWGCGYRTLQTILSWYKLTKSCPFDVPTLLEVQNILHEIGDKPRAFVGSHDWIGTYECGLVIQYVTKHDFKIIRVENGLFTEEIIKLLVDHFQAHGSPVMLGGYDDSSSKGIIAVKTFPDQPTMLLICDPHCFEIHGSPTIAKLCKGMWLRWCKVTELSERHFYNLCLPL
ncbi:unnamed protein product [Schistosoma margrebowiei]|uniref:UFSP1/2/DUB catalytic domain-containing protein n=1 Tax=Schistosoma margrebowiei TaxID=48269 RepID=A0AA85ADC5_9TREM|nr:unnamed protein product [Schistosoma margrebowiei]